jgi:hypothetical protein
VSELLPGAGILLAIQERILSMPFQPFYEIFPELAWKETRSVRISEDHPTLPADEFGFIELYCNDENCDCQRVMFDVLSRKRGKSVAVIAYGWQSADFYRKWTKSGDPEIVREMQGLILNPMSNQSELAPALLELIRKLILKDPAYVARVKRHYQMFKERLDPKHFNKTASAKNIIAPAAHTKKRHRPRSTGN